MIDADGGGTLSKAEIVDAVKNNDEVIKFLSNCGNENLQSLLVPSLERENTNSTTRASGEFSSAISPLGRPHRPRRAKPAHRDED